MSEAENPHYAERSDDDTSPQTGGGVEPAQGGDDPQVGGITEGAGEHPGDGEHGGHAQRTGTALSGEDAPHPAGDGERSDREVGGPRAAEDAPQSDGGGGKGDISTKGFEPHT